MEQRTHHDFLNRKRARDEPELENQPPRFASTWNHLHTLFPSFSPAYSETPLRTISSTAMASSTVTRTGNISPAHSDSSRESTSTCSSDEQLHHQPSHFHHTQPWRSYRERENYEQLLDLAEKLADPNRLNEVNTEKFASYRYRSSAQQAACVICMCQFKAEQHVRVLPCQHEYHAKCIARWFTMNSSCPICRREHFL